MAGWPWPLDGVQAWFEGLWNHISSAATQAVSVVSDWIWNAIYWVRDRIQEGITAIGDFLWEKLQWVKDRLVEGIGWVWDQIRPVLGPVADWIELAASWFWEGLWAFVQDPVGTMSAAWTWITETIWEKISWLKDRMSEGWEWLSGQVSTGLENLWAAVNSAVSTATTTITGAVSGLWDSLTGLAGDLLSGVTEALGTGLQAFFDWLLKHLTWLSSMIMGAVNAVVGAIQGFIMDLGRRFMDALTGVFTAGSPDKELENTMRVMVDTMNLRVVEEIKAMYESPPEIDRVLATAGSVAALLGVGILSVKVLASAADAAHPTKDIGFKDIATGMIAGTGAGMMMSSILRMPADIGLLMPLRHAYLSMFTPEIPGPTDLIRFVVREVISPEEFYGVMPSHGYSERWAKAYWDAHWVLPSFGSLVDAFHRKIIPAEDLEKFIVWHDYSPEPRPGTSKSDLEIMRGILKTLIPRVDARYAWELGIWTPEQLVEHYEILGYEEDASLMAQIQMARALVEEIHKVRDEWIRDFVEGYVLEDTLRANLAEIGIGPERIEYYVVYALKRRDREHKADLLDVYEDAYQKDLIEFEALEGRVQEILADAAAADVFLEKAWIKKYKAPKAS